jgi:succinate dehydrogenase/fumarate reductase-like Fe-S protein
MFDHLKRVHAWVELDGTYDLGPGPRMDNDDVLERYAYSRCMTCGNAQNCVKVCPMNIPLTQAIYEENRETVIHGLLGWLKH